MPFTFSLHRSLFY